MKYLNSIYDIILESVQSYDWVLISDTDKKLKYEFNDIEGNSYLVEIKSLISSKPNDISTTWELVYFVHNEDHYSVSKIVNVNPFKVLKTVFGDILNDFLKRKSWVKNVTFEGLSKDREKSYISQRTKMYVRYLERNPISGYKLSTYGNRINLTKL